MIQRFFITSALLVACGGPGAGSTTPAADPSTTATVAGKVRDRATGASLSFATVVASQAGTGERDPENTATTEGNGNFEIVGLQPGAYDLMVYYADVDVRWQRIDVKAGDRLDLNIEINAAGGDLQEVATASSRAPIQTDSASKGGRGILTGTIVDQASGEPLEGATIAATVDIMTSAHIALADENGKFLLVGLRPGTYKLSIFYRLIDYGDIEVSISNVEISGGKTTNIPIRLDTSVRAAD